MKQNYHPSISHQWLDALSHVLSASLPSCLLSSWSGAFPGGKWRARKWCCEERHAIPFTSSPYKMHTDSRQLLRDFEGTKLFERKVKTNSLSKQLPYPSSPFVKSRVTSSGPTDVRGHALKTVSTAVCSSTPVLLVRAGRGRGE